MTFKAGVRLKKKYDVLIEVTQGAIGDIRLLSPKKAEREWHKWGKKHGYNDYQDFLNDVQGGGVDKELRWFLDVPSEDCYCPNCSKKLIASTRNFFLNPSRRIQQRETNEQI